MLRIKEYTFKKKGFTLEDMIIWKLNPMKVMVDTIDDLIFPRMKADTPEEERVLVYLFELKAKIDDMEEILGNLDDDLRDMGFYSVRSEAPELVSAVS